MEVKDTLAARKLYQYAANAGHDETALALARTFDPPYFVSFGAVGLRLDPVLSLPNGIAGQPRLAAVTLLMRAPGLATPTTMNGAATRARSRYPHGPARVDEQAAGFRQSGGMSAGLADPPDLAASAAFGLQLL